MGSLYTPPRTGNVQSFCQHSVPVYIAVCILENQYCLSCPSYYTSSVFASKSANNFAFHKTWGGNCNSAQTISCKVLWPTTLLIFFVYIPFFHVRTKPARCYVFHSSWPWDDFAAPAHLVRIYFLCPAGLQTALTRIMQIF